MICVDGNNWSYRFKRQPHLSFRSRRGEPTGTIYGMLVAIAGLVRQFHDDDVLVAWDSKVNLRKSAHTDYKANRKHIGDEIIFQQMNVLHEVLPFFGYSSVRVEGYEADDVGYTLATMPHRYNTVFVSEDLDWLQFVSSTDSVWRQKALVETPLDYHYAAYHAFVGSRKDNVIGIPRFSKKLAMEAAKRLEPHQQVEIEAVLDYCKVKDEALRRVVQNNFDLLTLKSIPNLDTHIRPPVHYKPMLSYLCARFDFKNIEAQTLSLPSWARHVRGL